MATIMTPTATAIRSPKKASVTGEKEAAPNAQGAAWQGNRGTGARATGMEGTGAAWPHQGPSVQLAGNQHHPVATATTASRFSHEGT